MEYQVRAARITDIDRLVVLYDDVLRASRAADAEHPLDAADLLRQLVYLPQATILVAEARREVAGGAVLALRPSVRAGGFVGTVDLLVVDPRHDPDRVTEVLIEEVLRSARNKGCVAVEAAQPDDPAERTRWDRFGFGGAGPTIERRVAAERASSRH
ncbi:MAG TPA: GNAT family N-acetyltransferase [Candidatus Limnocylindrales bacterium]